MNKVVAILLVVAIGFFVFNKVSNMHMHKMADGTIVVHSHPYNKSADNDPYKSHHHTKSELTFFSFFELLFFFLFLTLTGILSIQKAKIPDFCYIFIRKLHFSNLRGRAPPFSSFQS